jgi:hypothetical protein
MNHKTTKPWQIVYEHSQCNASHRYTNYQWKDTVSEELCTRYNDAIQTTACIYNQTSALTDQQKQCTPQETLPNDRPQFPKLRKSPKHDAQHTICIASAARKLLSPKAPTIRRQVPTCSVEEHKTHHSHRPTVILLQPEQTQHVRTMSSNQKQHSLTSKAQHDYKYTPRPECIARTSKTPNTRFARFLSAATKTHD